MPINSTRGEMLTFQNHLIVQPSINMKSMQIISASDENINVTDENKKIKFQQ